MVNELKTDKSIVSDFMNPIRITILQLLSKSPSKFSDLAKEMDISNSEVSRHLKRLEQHGFVRKESREFILTSFGGLALTLFSPIEFIFKNTKYFHNHSVDDLSLNLIRNINSLIDCELIEGTGNVMLKLQEITESATKSTYLMSNQIFPFGKTGLDVKYLITPKVMQMGKETAVLNTNRSTDGRILQNVSIAMIMIDENKGMLFFSGSDNKPDFSSGFLIKQEDTIGIQYIKDIWEYFWEKAEIIRDIDN